MTLLLAVTLLAADGSYDADARVSYLVNSLAAVANTELDVLADTERFVQAMRRNKCRSAFHRLQIQCLLDQANRNCRSRKKGFPREACRLYSDIVVVNTLGEKSFISRPRRHQIMQRHRDYRGALRRELRREHGSIATEMTLSRRGVCQPADDDCLARSIDAYCRAAADERDLSWHHCAAALVWFIGTEGRPEGDSFGGETEAASPGEGGSPAPEKTGPAPAGKE